jgi:arsenate reductase
MAEAFLNHLAGNRFEATSAGLEKGTLNPLAVRVMSEVGIDISKNQTKDVFEFYKNGRLFNYVVTVCDTANSERCPIFPSASKTLHWSFTDPSSLSGTEEEKLEKTRKVRNEIEVEIRKFIESYS